MDEPDCPPADWVDVVVVVEQARRPAMLGRCFRAVKRTVEVTSVAYRAYALAVAAMHVYRLATYM